MIVHKKSIRFAMEKIALALSLLLYLPSEGLSQTASANDKNHVSCLAISGNKIFAGSDHGVFVTTNKGSSWTPASNGLTDRKLFVTALAVSGANIFAGTDGGVVITTNNGNSWTSFGEFPANCAIRSLLVSGSNVFAGTFFNGVYISTNNGASWGLANEGILTLGQSNKETYADQSYPLIYSLAIIGDYLFAGTEDGIYRTSVGSIGWNPVNRGLPSNKYSIYRNENPSVKALAAIGGNLFVGVGAHGVYRSVDNGATWSAVNSGLTDTLVNDLGLSGGNLFAGTWKGIFLSTDNGTSWIASGLTNKNVSSITVIDTALFALLDSHAIFHSTDNGANWTAFSEPVHMKSKKEMKEDAQRGVAEEKRAAVIRKNAVRLLTPDVIDALANQFLDFSEATKLAFNLNMSLGTNFDGRRLWAAANGGGIKSYFEQQFQSVPEFDNMKLGIISRMIGLTYDQSRALQGK